MLQNSSTYIARMYHQSLPNNIKAIIFDLGGVILNIDFTLAHKALAELGVKNSEGMYAQESANTLFKKLEHGHLTPDEFCDIFRKETGLDVSNEKIIAAVNSMLIDFRKESLAFIQQLRKNYKVYILSNTNAIHRAAFDKIYTEEFGSGFFTDLFDNAYFSHEIGYRKPDAAAYQFVLDDNDLKAEECLFVDDTIENVEAAKIVGMGGCFLGKGFQIENVLRSLVIRS